MTQLSVLCDVEVGCSGLAGVCFGSVWVLSAPMYSGDADKQEDCTSGHQDIALPMHSSHAPILVPVFF